MMKDVPTVFTNAQRNDFVAPTNVQGSFVQPNPDPVVFTADFQQGLQKLTQEALSVLHQLGSAGRDYR
jgi:hypothetical protein